MTLNKEMRDLREKESELIDGLAVAIANRESLDDELRLSKKERDKLKSKGQEYDKAALKKLNEAIRVKRVELIKVRKNIVKRRRWLKRTRIRIGKKRREIRNAARPKIVSLSLDFKPMERHYDHKRVIGHYTAGPRDENDADCERLCRAYHQAHLANGWSGEGYHICISRSGTIFLLRPAEFVGAHTLGANTESYGIMMHGTTGDKPTKAQRKTLKWLSNHGHKNLMKSGKAFRRLSEVEWFGHNDFNPTGCPGDFKPAYVNKGA